jgi:hypothetical protein
MPKIQFDHGFPIFGPPGEGIPSQPPGGGGGGGGQGPQALRPLTQLEQDNRTTVGAADAAAALRDDSDLSYEEWGGLSGNHTKCLMDPAVEPNAGNWIVRVRAATLNVGGATSTWFIYEGAVELATGTFSVTGSLTWHEASISAPSVTDYTDIQMQTESSVSGAQPVRDYEWEIRLP